MYYVGINLHKRDLVAAVEDERAPVGKPRRFACRDEAAIVTHFSGLRPFRAVIEASASYRWLYDRLSPLGEIILAHPLRLRASIARPAKTDKLDAALLARLRLLRMDQIPESYVPPKAYQVSAGIDSGTSAAEPLSDGGKESTAPSPDGAQH